MVRDLKPVISKAINLTSRDLEKEVARVQAQVLTPERAKYVTENRVNLNLGLSEKFYKRLKRVQELESQRLRRAVTIEETEEAMIDLYLEKKDPVEKAKRKINAHAPVTGHVESLVSKADEVSNKVAKKITLDGNSKRKPLRAQLRHQVNLRDQGKCTEEKCDQQRWLDIHHIIPVNQGGQNTLENLRTLCSGHHKLEHDY